MLRLLLAGVASAIGLVATLPVLILVGPFWIVAAITRLVHRLMISVTPQAAPWRELVEFEPVVGWKPIGCLNTYGKADRPFHFTTDADGWRGRSSLEECDLVVIGDSFAFGHGTDDKEFFADLHPTIRMKAVGVNGYSMVHEFLWMKRLSARLSRKLVVWFIYYGNDLFENLQPNLERYRMPFVREANVVGGWEIVTDHVSRDPWPFTPHRHYYELLAEICSPGYLSERVFSACRFLIAEANDLCKAINAQIAVVGIPEITQIGVYKEKRLADYAKDAGLLDATLPDRTIGQICRELGLPFVALSDYLTSAHYKTDDCHWNRKGHVRVAELLGALYELRAQLLENDPRGVLQHGRGLERKKTTVTLAP